MLHSEALQVPGTVQVLEAGQKVQPSRCLGIPAPGTAASPAPPPSCRSLTCRLCSNSSSTRVLTPNSWSISSSSLAYRTGTGR